MKLDIQECYELLLRSSKELYFETKESKKSIDKALLILKTAIEIGLGHLKLLRKAKTISAGEYQRLLLLKYLSYEGTGSLFVFDEPSLGLSLEEKKALLKGFKRILDLNNTVILVEHCEYFRKQSDYLIEIGPGSGHLGGEVLFSGEKADYKFEKKKKKLQALEVDENKRKWI
ncbi:MAG: hypothetical protein OIF32_12635, partial [Campylobacterales bacterium]|nr:hypothetical protein [Campylobacterales bacterium]